MSFRDDAQLDPSEVQRPARPRRSRGRIAIGGGGLGVAAIIVIVLLQLLGGGGGLGQLGQLEGATSGTPTGDLADCRTGADANARQDCRILAYVNSVQAFWRQEFERRGRTYVPATTYFESGQWQTACGAGQHRRRPVLLPGRQARLHRPGLPRRAARPLRRDRRVARAGLRHRPRVRPSRPGSARHPQERQQRRGCDGQVCAHRAAGRLLRGRVGGARDRDGLAGADHAGADRRRPERRGGCRRRSHPESDAGPGEPRRVDARLLRAAPALVQDGLPDRRHDQVRHVRRSI